jgi:DNA modification methylase
LLGRHRLACGDARDAGAYDALMAGQAADMLFTDPPYNVPIDGFAGGKGKVERREFAMASGEMGEAQFQAFLEATLGPAAAVTRDGAIAFVCMDWRHVGELLAAGAAVFDELKNICVWTKTNGGMGSLYRSQHELVFVFKKGRAPQCNNVELGRHGRNRTNVWAYAGANAFGAAREAELAMHPTVKPVALIEDAIKDVTRRGALVLDPFGGSGSTLIAAERCGRLARVIEIDPLYCDTIIKRFEAYTGKQALLEASAESYETLREVRCMQHA